MAKILFVDDEPDILEVFGSILRKEGHNVTAFDNGRAALEELKKDEKPDLIILDVMMPEMDGWEVCKTIKTNADTKDITVVMLTVRRSYQDKIKSFYESLADGHIAKPVDKDTFLEGIRGYLKE
ncbi:MAG: response regulator [Candidatus Hydrothermarchaeales archaeon]